MALSLILSLCWRKAAPLVKRRRKFANDSTTYIPWHSHTFPLYPLYSLDFFGLLSLNHMLPRPFCPLNGPCCAEGVSVWPVESLFDFVDSNRAWHVDFCRMFGFTSHLLHIDRRLAVQLQLPGAASVLGVPGVDEPDTKPKEVKLWTLKLCNYVKLTLSRLLSYFILNLFLPQRFHTFWKKHVVNVPVTSVAYWRWPQRLSPGSELVAHKPWKHQPAGLKPRSLRAVICTDHVYPCLSNIWGL